VVGLFAALGCAVRVDPDPLILLPPRDHETLVHEARLAEEAVEQIGGPFVLGVDGGSVIGALLPGPEAPLCALESFGPVAEAEAGRMCKVR
jgi:hypothetical protein